MKTIQFVNSEHCVGCAACVSICPKEAIGMKVDEEGFMNPIIDEDKCVDCGLCVTVCPVLCLSIEREERMMPLCYAAWSKDEEVRENSTSGGVFSHLAYQVIHQGGIVVGARYKENHLVEHGFADTIEGVKDFRQSKYVQSDMKAVFPRIKRELMSGRLVMFSGTPCQCAGVRAYLGKEYENLLLCDFICLGVNSPLVYLTYIEELEKKYKSKVKRIWFKNKSFSWNQFATKIFFENGEVYIADREEDLYMQGYIKANRSLYMRRSCYDCRFRGIRRPVDFTLGDFWGIERYEKGIDTRKGISAVLIQSSKGESFFEQCKSSLHCCVRDVEDVLPCNPRMVNNVERSKERSKFFEKMIIVGFTSAIQELMEEEGGK